VLGRETAQQQDKFVHHNHMRKDSKHFRPRDDNLNFPVISDSKLYNLLKALVLVFNLQFNLLTILLWLQKVSFSTNLVPVPSVCLTLT
jgi:hypothetical protein